jgi:uncharacterized phage protein gp47/JayE
MGSYGVTATGFGLKDQEQVESEIIDEQIASPDLPAVLDQSSSSPLGQLNGAVSLQLAELWEVAQAMYRAGDPDSASGNALSILSRLTGTIPKEATEATVTLKVNLDAGVTITAGRLVSSSVDSNVVFATLVDATNSGGAPADVNVAAQALSPGVLASASIASATLTVIETPVTGWNTCTNDSAATNGTAAETDDELRLRRAEELTGQGASNIDSIRAGVTAITTVTDAEVFENDTLVTDGDGVPGKAFDTVVYSSGSDDNNIAQAIWDNKPAGIQAYGSTDTGTALDTQGDAQVMAFTRATEKDIDVEVDITKDAATYPATGDTQIKNAILAVINALGIDDDVYQSPLIAATMEIVGVVNVPDLRMAIKPAAPSTVASLAIGTREIARIVVGDILVTAV